MLIDWHVHIHDIKDQLNPYWKGKCPMTPENVLAALEGHVLAEAKITGLYSLNPAVRV